MALWVMGLAALKVLMAAHLGHLMLRYMYVASANLRPHWAQRMVSFCIVQACFT